MILADTSAWVEYGRATGSAVDQRMTELLTAEGALAVTEPVMMEVSTPQHACTGSVGKPGSLRADCLLA